MLCTGLLTPHREPMTDQHTNSTKVQLGKPVSFPGVTYRPMNELLLTGTEMTQSRCIHNRGPPPALETTHKSWEPRASSQPEGSSGGWRVSFQGGSIVLNLFQAVCLDFASFTELGLV